MIRGLAGAIALFLAAAPAGAMAATVVYSFQGVYAGGNGGTLPDTGPLSAEITVDSTPTLIVGSTREYAVTAGYIQFGDGPDVFRATIFPSSGGVVREGSYFQINVRFPENGLINWELHNLGADSSELPTSLDGVQLDKRLVNGDAFWTALGLVGLPRPVIPSLEISTSPAPEPAAWAMMILGLAGVGGVVRRRRPGGCARAPDTSRDTLYLGGGCERPLLAYR